MNSDDRIYKKLLEHDKRFDQNDKRWEQNDKRWEQNDKRWEQNDKRWEKNEKCLDQLIKKLFSHDDEFIKVRKEIKDLRDEFLHGQDIMMTILKRLDEERVFTATWIERVEKEVKRLAQESVQLTKESAQHAKEIRQVKVRLKIA